jgi:nucleoside-diphosphate-sugar epimerase
VFGVLTGTRVSSSDRVVLLQQQGQRRDYSPIAHGSIDLMTRPDLGPWIDEEPDAVVYLAGVNSETVRNEPALGQELHVSAFRRLVEAMAPFRARSIVVYASSTAVHSAQSEYASQKAEAEGLLLGGDTAGIALRFPTVLPRGNASSRTAFLDEAVRQLSSGKDFRWPIAADRRMRLMSSAAAARHLSTAIGIGAQAGQRVLDLPAAVATPRDLCGAAGSGPPHTLVQQDIDQALAARIVDVDASEAARLGFPPAESVDQLLVAARSALPSS